MKKSPKTLVGLLVICGVVLLWFSPWLVGGRVLAPLDIANEMMQPWRGSCQAPDVKNHMVSDSVTQYLGYRIFAAKQLQTEGRIGWSDLTYGGTATYANTMALFDDWTMQLHRWFGFWTAWHLGLIGQVLLAGTGMFLFLRGRAIGATLAVAGALAWAGNSQFVCWMNHRWALSAFCWLPWVFLSLDRVHLGQRAWFACVPAFLALGFLGGTLQHAGLLVLCVLCYWLSEAKGLSLRHRVAGARKYLLWGLLAVGLAAFMFFPQIEAFRISNGVGLHFGMFQGLEDGVYPKGVLQPLCNFAAYPLQFFPSVLGACDSIDLLKLFKSELLYVAYFGSLPVLIAFLGLFRRNTPPLAWWLMTVGLILPLTPLVRVLYQRLFLLFIFGGILAFVSYVQHASVEDKKRHLRWIGRFLLVGVVGWLGVSVFLVTGGVDLLDRCRETIVERGGGSTFGSFEEWMGARADRFLERLVIWSPWQLISLSLLALGLFGVWLSVGEVIRLRGFGMTLLAVVVVGETTVFAHRWVTWTDPLKHPLYSETEEVRQLRAHVADGRIKNLIHPTAHMPKTPLMPNTLVPYGIATIDGYDSIVPDGMTLPFQPILNAKVLARQGVSHLLAPRAVDVDEPGWVAVWESESTRIYENQEPALRYAGFSSLEEVNRFVEGDFSSAPVELLEQTGKMNTRVILVPRDVEWIRIAENHLNGWEWRNAATSGVWSSVERGVDRSMLVGPLSSGASEPNLVEMRFDPRSRRLGSWVSWATSALLVSMGIRGVWPGMM